MSVGTSVRHAGESGADGFRAGGSASDGGAEADGLSTEVCDGAPEDGLDGAGFFTNCGKGKTAVAYF